MEERQIKQKAVEEYMEEHGSRIGTWFSLGVVAAVILATYLLMFSVYLARV
ncbi:hypothetical protein [Halalkalibacter alkalisediminis]|uniref:Uncharacterized protein n=1 Tax=Halalkalibacter alkalisediminis TaxID=935616 RepID=A0ABV6NCH7_9BACI|nr:hypothetical protein [Halalkalibacter alkalisediminis]